MDSQFDWQYVLYNGLVPATGKTPRVASTNITKPMHDKQLSEILPPTPEVIDSNRSNRGPLKNSKLRFSIHRSMSFMPQKG